MTAVISQEDRIKGCVFGQAVGDGLVPPGVFRGDADDVPEDASGAPVPFQFLVLSGLLVGAAMEHSVHVEVFSAGAEGDRDIEEDGEDIGEEEIFDGIHREPEFIDFPVDPVAEGGGEVYGILRPGGNYHCYNVIGGHVFDLTSEQFGERAKSLVYDCSMLQDRESSMHFGKAEKRQRYEYLKSRLQPVSKGHFYYVRHGQTVWNVENKICGATDSPLTEAGRNQAKEVAEKILAEGLHIDEILYSPLSRARDTAMEISKAIGVPARVEVRLVEQDFGKWEGTARNGEAFRLAKQSFATSNEGGESMLKLCQRIYNLMDELKKEPDKVRLLVAHNGIARAVQSYFTDMTNEEFAAFGIRNCEIRRFDFAQEGKQTGREDG